MEQPIRVLLVEDHEIVREGTRQLLERAEEFVVVGEAGDGEAAVRLVAELRPDVVVMDIRMPKLNGLEATKRIKAAHPEVSVVVLSAYEDDQYVVPILQAGADAYLLKTTSGRELAATIRAVVSGQTVLDPEVRRKVVGQLGARHQPGRADGPNDALSPRELEVLHAVAEGKSNKEIADQLVISVYTAQVHLRNIMSKLEAANRTDAVTRGLALGVIQLRGRPE